MIIWGSYVMRKTLKIGSFYCPNCTETRAFIHKLPRRWGHLYWIPLIPMETYDSYVECQTCQKAYREEAIDHDPRRDRERLLTGIATMIGQVMTHVAHANRAGITVPAIEAGIREVLQTEGLPPGTAAGIGVPLERGAMLDAVRTFGDYLLPRAQERVLRVAIGTAPPSPEARALLAEVGAAMGMTSAHLSGVLAEAAPPPGAASSGAAA